MAYLSLGANLGDRAATLREALRRLAASEGVELTAVSSVYETEPWGRTDQPRFLNLAAALRTTLAPETLLMHAQAIETALGRVRREKWGARVIDIDLLCMEGVAMQSPSLTLPHPYLTERAFVLVPLSEIAPDLVIAGQPVEAWRDEVGREGVVRIRETE
ncbi:MAG: 2-amino-4-hydroxy-6-hydroxymethyldihydropteridine diphosphokinase [Oscillospiraceae bacterium]|nr:2-amino-4-hydroxy-6-hydroxymethyldihydropteridine diphosphokinase [Oscillospiraceae bacterium]